ncbi:MAG TPA: hypothetical protein VGE74_00615 [Gemmata sp.]
MRASTSRVWVAVVCATLGASGALAAGQPPAAKEKTKSEAWLPEFATFRANRHNECGDLRVPPSAFPKLETMPAEWDGKEKLEALWKRREAAFDKLCPRLRGETGLKIEPTDDALRKVRKARVQQCVLEYQEERRFYERFFAGPDPHIPGRDDDRLLELSDALTELWAGHSKELASWLEELVVLAKEQERGTRLRAEAGARKPQDLTSATRARLQIELALWRAKNPNAAPAKRAPAKKDEKAPEPPKGDWLSDKEPPPSLFPDTVLPPIGPTDFDGWSALVTIRLLTRHAAFCPRLFGAIALKIEPSDDTARTLLKARLHQGTLQYRLTQLAQIDRGPDPSRFAFDANGLLDMQSAARELWADQPKELALWLEELLRAAKEQERYTKLRVEAGALLPQRLPYISQVRLKIEAELWKAKNAK